MSEQPVPVYIRRELAYRIMRVLAGCAVNAETAGERQAAKAAAEDFQDAMYPMLEAVRRREED